MGNLGDRLRTEREARKLSASEVAAATHMKVQHVEALEQNDFSSIAAPAYAKGFIKLYAEFLDLDPAPLISEYVAEHGPGRPVISHDPPPDPPAADKPRGRTPTAWPAWLRKLTWQQVAVCVGGVIIAIFVISAMSRFFRASSPGAKDGGEAEKTALSEGMIGEPPAPYMDYQE